jgi:hypothetical protein
MPEAIAMLRVGQLLLGSIIGLVCIYLGYKLFAQIPVTVTNDGHFKMPKIGEVKLKVAPGVFFAILGAAIVYFSIDRPITISSDTSSTGGADSASAKAKSFGYETTPSGSHFKYGQQGK